MTEIKKSLAQEYGLSLERIDWQDKGRRRAFEAELRRRGLVVAVAKDGTFKEVMPLKDWTPDDIFTLKWNSASMISPVTGEWYEDPLPPDWSLVPNAKGRLDLNDLELLHGVKYAIEGETGLIAEVQEDGTLKLLYAGVYQDISNRDVSPAGKVWGSGPVAGMSPLWVEIDSWDDFIGAELNATIEGVKADDIEGEAKRVESFPAEIEKLARNWREELIKVLVEHEVYVDAKIKPGTRFMFTSGLLYWAQEYGTRFFQTEITPIINAHAVLSFLSGIEVESEMVAHTVVEPEYEVTEVQGQAISLWQNNQIDQNVGISAQEVDVEIQAGYIKDRANQMDKGKLGRLVSENSFVTTANPDLEKMREVLPSITELRARYQQIKENWSAGAGIDLLLVRNGISTPEREGKLPGVIKTEVGILDDTIAKRSAQRSYDIATQLWDVPAPDLVIASGRTSAMATIDVALWSIGQPYPVKDIQRDWRLNERSFGDGVGHFANEFSEEELHSFEKAINSGENFSFVHLKVLSFMLDLLETANQFYQENGRAMKVVVSSQEGPVQLMQAILKGLTSKADIFAPVESTYNERFILDKPFDFPAYASDELVEEATDIEGQRLSSVIARGLIASAYSEEK